MKESLQKLFAQEDLQEKELRHAIESCIHGNVTDSQIAALLTGLRIKGETAEEIATIADVIRSQSMMRDINLDNAMDNCGTGGDQSYSFNISTTAAFVLAGAGITVAKHGNRSISSKTGSADVLEELGVSLDFSKEEAKYLLEENGITFLFAPHVHQSLRPFMKVRKDLALPTIFNLIGPLTNPVHLDSQLMGVYTDNQLVTLAQALKNLGRKRALVVHGAGGMDEASLAGENKIAYLNDGQISEFTLTPEDYGFQIYSLEDIQGGNAKDNARILLSVLENEASPYLDTVLLNAGLGIFANGKVDTIEDGIELAKETIAQGRALAKLDSLITYSKNRKEAAI